jgi:hypothetical protein
MAEAERPTEPAPEEPRPPRRRWELPRIQSGQMFETNSLMCLKTGPFDCDQAGGDVKS